MATMANCDEEVAFRHAPSASLCVHLRLIRSLRGFGLGALVGWSLLAAMLCSRHAAAAVQPTSHPTPDQLVALEEILHLLPKSEPWQKWVQATGTAPPDFAQLPNIPFLPDPLRFVGGKEVKRDTWPRRRAE